MSIISKIRALVRVGRKSPAERILVAPMASWLDDAIADNKEDIAILDDVEKLGIHWIIKHGTWPTEN